VLPFIVGGLLGVPLGAFVLPYINPAQMRIGVGLVLILYSTYNLARPAFAPIETLWVAACGLLKLRVLGRVTAADFLSGALEFPCLSGFCLFGHGVSP
jgi:uncharacterized membrane protein YfcA